MISEIATVTRNDDAQQSQLRPSKPQTNSTSNSRSSKSEKPWLRHIEDLRMIACTGLFFAVFLFAWRNYTSPLSGGWVSFVTWLSLFQLSFMGAVATHNAIHVPVFWKPVMNNLYQICLSLQYGFPVSVFVPGHNLSHHKYPQQARDISMF
jgi:fatty acid desaturase